MADYFGKYKGRSGPAIDPGIVQMMGSIGDEYAEGIRSIGAGIGDALKSRAEQKKAEEANKLWKEILGGGKHIEDPEAYGEAVLKQTEDKELAIEEARIAEEEVDKIADETSAMRDRLDTKSIDYEDLTYGHPLSQVRKVGKERDKFSKKLDSWDSSIKDANTQKIGAQLEIQRLEKLKGGRFIPFETGQGQEGGYYEKETALTEDQKADLKRAKEVVSNQNDRIKQIKSGPSYDTLSKYVTKLDSLHSLENEMPGSTIGFNKLKRNSDNDWVSEESEAGRIVDERARVYTKQKDDGVFKGGKIAEQLLGFNPRYSPEALQGVGVKQEDLERFMTLPQDRLSDRETAAKDRYRGTQKRLEELQEAPMLDPSDFMRKQTREELVSEVMHKVDTGLLKSNVLPNLAAFLDKTKAPEARLVNMGGRSFVISDPGSTAIQAVADPHTFANQLSVAKFKVGLEEAGRAGTIAARKYFNSQMVEVNDAIAKFEIAQKTNTWTGDDMRSWDAELDAKRLQELYDRKKDITDFYSQTNERIKPTGGVQTIKTY